MIDSAASILALLAMTIAAFGIGRAILRGLAVGEREPLDVAVWSTALGLVAWGLVLMGLGLVGWLYRPAIIFLTLLSGLYGFCELICARLNQRFAAEGLRSAEEELAETAPVSPLGRWSIAGAVALAGIALTASLVGALAPPTAGDALCYHLDLPKTYLARHAIDHLPYNDRSTFPLLTEMWFTWGLAIEGGVAAQLVHWGLGLLLALAAVVLARSIVGRPWDWLAGAIVALVPGVNNEMTAPLNDVALATFTTLALAAWWRGAVDDEHPRWRLVAGVMFGAALGVKYLAALFVAGWAVSVLWTIWRRPKQRAAIARGAVVAATVALVVGGAWYARGAVHRGNPVFPYFQDYLRGGGPVTFKESKRPLKWSVDDLAIAPWELTMRPERFGGRAHQLGVVFLLVSPGLFCARRLRGVGVLLAIAGVYLLGWYALQQNLRFLFPLAPLLAIPATWCMMELRRAPTAPRWVLCTMCGAAFLFSTAIAVQRPLDQFAVAAGLESRDEYLARSEPTYAAAAWVNPTLHRDAHILSQDHRGFYFRGQFTCEEIFHRETAYDEGLAAPADFSRALRAKGITHLLLADATGPGIEFPRRLTDFAEAELAAGSDRLIRLRDYEFADVDGSLRRYRLFQLGD